MACVIATNIGTSLLSLNVYEIPATDNLTLLNLTMDSTSHYLVDNVFGSITQAWASEVH